PGPSPAVRRFASKYARRLTLPATIAHPVRQRERRSPPRRLCGREIGAFPKLLADKRLEARVGEDTVDNLGRVIGVHVRQPMALCFEVRPTFLGRRVDVVEHHHPAWLQDPCEL